MKYLEVKYVNNCIKNAILSSTKCDKEANSLVIADITCTYFDLTNQQMSDKQVCYIENLSHKQTWSVMKCLKYLTSKIDTKSVEQKYRLNENHEIVKKEHNYEVTYENVKRVILKDFDKATLYIEGFLRTKLSNWRMQSNNLSFFQEPKHRICSKNQIEYLIRMIDEKFYYSLSDIQIKCLSKLNIKQVSYLISSIKEMNVIIKSELSVHKFN